MGVCWDIAGMISQSFAIVVDPNRFDLYKNSALHVGRVCCHFFSFRQWFSQDFYVRWFKISVVSGRIWNGNEIASLREVKSSLSEFDQMKVNFLKAAIHFFPQVSEDGADLGNAAFTFALPGNQFVLISGAGDWEYYFSLDDNNKIIGRCKHKPRQYYVWDGIKFTICRIPEYLSTALAIVDGVKTLKNAWKNLELLK